MISKRTPPPRPPLPSRKTDTSSKQESHETSPVKKLDFFSIRYSRDDTNESDEEISIVRKEDSVEDEDVGSNKEEQCPDASEDIAENAVIGTGSLLSSISLPFLSKSPSRSSSESLASEDKAKIRPEDDSASEKSLKTSESVESEGKGSLSANLTNKGSHFGEGSIAHGRHSVFPAKRRTEKIANSVVSSAVSLSSLLKKEIEQKTHFGKGSSNDSPKEDGSHVSKQEQLPMGMLSKGVLSTAVANTSRLLVPFGISNMQAEAGYERGNSEEEDIYTDVPLYNILVASAVVFLYLMLPTSSFVNGFVFGGFLMFFVVCAMMWLLTPEMSDEERYKRDLLEHRIEMETSAQKQPRQALAPSQLSKPHDLEGWFFKASSYSAAEPLDFSDPDQVKPVYVSLSGQTMTFNMPRKDELSKINRRNMLEPNVNVKFSSSKEYDLGHSGEIDLVPETLTLKRIWAKKYPIYLSVFEKLSPKEDEDPGDNQDNFELPSVTEEMYLFSPTGRSKEEWYYRIEKLLKPRTHQQNSVCEFESIFNAAESFPHYMARLIGAEGEPSSQAQLTWVNALLGRLFWDVWRSEYWNNKMKSRIQNKISRMKLPPFIRYLKVTDMRLGHALPTIQRAHNLLQDNRGIWVDLEVDYQGGIMLTIETMVDLEYYLKQLTDQGKGEGEEVVLRFSRDENGYSDVSSAESDTEEVDGDWNDPSLLSPSGHRQRTGSFSGEGSMSGDNSSSEAETDGERRSVGSPSPSEPTPDQNNQGWAGKVKNTKGKKILNMLEKVAKSKWVQKAAETKVVQRAVEKVSNLPIVLGVEVVRLRGTLAANIPPPPSNRLWLGFHSNPLLSLIARPKLGERHVRLTQVTDWIEYKLKQEFKSMFVLPNMEDLTIRIMDSGLEDKFPTS